MKFAARTLLFASLSPIALAAPASAQENQAAAQTPQAQAASRKSRRADHRRHRHPPFGQDGRGQPGPGRRHRLRGDCQHRPDRNEQDPQPARSVLQLPAAVDCRRLGHAASRYASRSQPRPDLGPRQRQAPPRLRASQHQRHGRSRQRRRRSQLDSGPVDQPRRSAARRRGRAIWLGRHRRRHQHPAEERRSRGKGEPYLRPILDHDR